MDWKKILSLTPDELTDAEKDELFNTITWYDEIDRVNIRKCRALFKISQAVLKYKGEQVETLLHELDDLAIKQGEEDGKKTDSDIDVRSPKSKKSSSIEYENIEQKYNDLKLKYKKQLKINRANVKEVEKLKNKVETLESENEKLQFELETKSHADSDSNGTDTIRDQHKELIDVVHNKNKQISDLLADIESIEKDNFILREKLTDVRDELSNATKEITDLQEKLNASEIKLQESYGQISKHAAQLEIAQEQIQDLELEKENLQKEMEDFTREINIRIDDWKIVLEEKDKEIIELKAKTTSIHSSSSSVAGDLVEQTQLSALNKVLNERERQLLEVQSQLQMATKEMEKSTTALEKVKNNKELTEKENKKLSKLIKDLQNNLENAHERSQELQEEITFADRTILEKDKDLKQIYDKLKETGNIDLGEKLNDIQILKYQNRLQEKQISSLVKATNKLQINCENFEKENVVLRDKLGIPDDETVSTKGLGLKQKKQKREIELLKKQVKKLEEKNLILRTEIHEQNKKLSTFSDQHTKDIKSKPTEFSKIDKIELKGLVDENEALRKGMHEILESINAKKSSSITEIKSETLEKLLRALDVKHVSGWYHPAMRLQAELHNLQGINTELREQLRNIRIEYDLGGLSARSKDKEYSEGEVNEKIVTEKGITTGEMIKFDGTETIEGILEKLNNVLKKLHTEHLEVEGLTIILKEIDVLRDKYIQEKSSLSIKMADLDNDNKDLLEKLSIFTENQTEDLILKKLGDMADTTISNNRKVTYLESEINNLNKIIETKSIDINNSNIELTKVVNELKIKNENLKSKLSILENLSSSLVDSDLFFETKKNLENLTVKHREILNELEKNTEEKTLELKILTESNENCERDKVELKNKLNDILTKYKSLKYTGDVNENVEKLAKKLAESEVNELSEKQRANHTNNLYELVKEQLHKSEERFKDFSKYNEEILHKNLILQEQLKDAEENLTKYISNIEYKQLIDKNNKLIEEIEQLKIKLIKVEREFEVYKIEKSSEYVTHFAKEQELLSLKHQIVDLIADSDEKIQISQLHSNIGHYKSLETENQRRIDILTKENENYKSELENIEKKYDEIRSNSLENSVEFKKKLGLVQELLIKQKVQYLGCIPLISEQLYAENLRKVCKEKYESFRNVLETRKLQNDSLILKEQLECESQNMKQQQNLLSGDKEEFKNMLNWIQEKKKLQLNELKYKRQSEFKELQLKNLMERVNNQDQEISKLEEEILQCHKNSDFTTTTTSKQEEIKPKPPPRSKLGRAVSVQTEEKYTTMNLETAEPEKAVLSKENSIDDNEYEKIMSSLKKQLEDKQSQISFYEKHIIELQSKMDKDKSLPGGGGDNVHVGSPIISNNEEILDMKSTIGSLQEKLLSKEKDILEYQSLLKSDRDIHSMAASRFQEEIKSLQRSLNEEKQNYKQLEESIEQTKPGRAAIDQYVEQVRALEKHTGELHTNISSLDAQLQASRQEAARWKMLSNERLEAIEHLRKNLEERHLNELAVYKEDTNKWRDEVNNLENLISRYRNENNYGTDVQRVVKEKENKIHELSVLLRQAKRDTGKVKEKEELSPKSRRNIDSDGMNEELLQKEYDTLKRRHDTILNRERLAREEIKELKNQLIRKPMYPRVERNERSLKDQLQKKLFALENEVIELKEALATQISINETHKIKIAEDFDRWKRQKQLQQNVEKLKNKLKEKESEIKKLQQTNAGFRILIERIERDKHGLEARIKNLKSSGSNTSLDNKIEMLRIENMKLLAENQSLTSRLEMTQHHSGGLGAVMLGEKLEAQERKIAVLELSGKGTCETRAEIERLKSVIADLQKSNLRLEAENLEFNLDLEKSNKEMPNLRDQILYLENYIEVLKKENYRSPERSSDKMDTNANKKKLSELEHTVFVLKRVVEKLQVENKRLVNGKGSYTPRSDSGDKCKRDYVKIKEKYDQSLQKILKLEQSLAKSEEKYKMFTNKPISENMIALSNELERVKEQLEQKSHLLDKVKVLLHRAALREKELLQEISELKSKVSERNIE